MLDSSSSLPQSLSPSHSHRRGMQRLFWHLNRSAGQVCSSGRREKKHKIITFNYAKNNNVKVIVNTADDGLRSPF